MKDVEGKVAFITGAASGMGFGMADAFSEAGMKVMLADIDETALAKAEKTLKDKGREAASLVCDVSDRDNVFAAAKKTVDTFGRVHVVCLNAGVGAGGNFDELDQADWDWVIGVNQMGVLYGIQAFLPIIKNQGEGGHIMATSSMAGLVPAGAGWGPYNATKYAAVAMCEVLRQELKDTKIGVSVLCPGAVNTNILHAAEHRPERFGKSDRAVASDDITTGLSQGLDPRVVGDLVLAAVRDNQFYIFTDPSSKSWFERRVNRINKGYEWLEKTGIVQKAGAA